MTEAAAWSYRPRRNFPVLRRWVLAKYPPVSIPNQNRRARLALLALFVAPFVISLASTSVQGASNEPPAIWGKPPTYAPRDVLYSFTPRAADADGDRLTFSIVNKPKWMWFDTRTGQLRGKPKWAQRSRTFSNIVIQVSDGRATTALPAFSIRVSATSGGGSGAGGGGGGSDNSAPTISGNPPTKVKAGTEYHFKPAARDADGDKLSFSIVNRPAWALFSTATGLLHGTPGAKDEGAHQNITIRVSDGKKTTSLKPFTVTVLAAENTSRSVTLSWTPPALNTDGSKLTDLRGYRVFYGMKSRQYSNYVDAVGAATRSVELQELKKGTWYFAIKSVNRAGVESDFSGEVHATL
jgi:hypothetical protein